MERLKGLGNYQKGVLAALAVMLAVFTALYPMTIAREGFAYQNAILVPSQAQGDTVYAGKINGEPVRFVVSENREVTFHHGEKVYGPYTVREDESAMPKDNDGLFGRGMTGIELRRGDEIMFRGGMESAGEERWLFDENGELYAGNIEIWATMSDGTVIAGDGVEVDPLEPSVHAILDVLYGPQMTHKGDWSGYALGLFVCVATAVSILFADELFRWNLSFQIRDAQQAEPSDWQIASRYIAWTALPIMALVAFIMGLQ